MSKIFKFIKAWVVGLSTLIRVSFTGVMSAEDPIVIYAGTSLPSAIPFGLKVFDTAVGKKLFLAKTCALKEKLTNYSYLESLPENSLGKLYLAFYRANNLSNYGEVGDFKKEVNYGHREKRGWNKIETYHNESLRFFDEVSWQHDLMHILSDNKADRLGEIAVHAFLWEHLRFMTPKLIVVFMCLGEILMTRSFKSIPIAQKNYRIGKAAKWLFPVDWVSYLDKDIDEVRKEFAIVL